MQPLLLCIVLQALSFTQGFNSTDDLLKNLTEHADQSDKQIDPSTLSLSEGCFGVLRALYQNTTVDVTLNLLDAQQQENLANQTCKSLGCGQVFKHDVAATVQTSTCLANCILRDSKLHNCSTTAEDDCTNASKIICERQAVQLVGGHDSCAGRVELLHSGIWGTVCDDYFDMHSGNAVCAQLGCGTAVKMSFFGAGTGPIHISKMKCKGTENNLWDCTNETTPTPSNFCGHKEDSGIVCSGSSEIPGTTANISVAGVTTQTAESPAVLDKEQSSGLSGAAIGCCILSFALLLFIFLNAAVCLHFKRRRACVIHQQHYRNSLSDMMYQSRDEIGVYNQQLLSVDGARQSESLGPGPSSDYGRKCVGRRNRVPDHSSDSDYEQLNNEQAQRLHPNNAPTAYVDDSDSTSSGEGYQNTSSRQGINMDTFLMSGEETPSLDKSLLAPLSYGSSSLPATQSQAANVSDSDSTSSDEDYQQTDINKNIPQSREDTPALDKSLLTPLTYDDHQLSGAHSQAADVNDSDSTSSGEDYQNAETNVDSNLQPEDEESPSLPEKSLETPQSAQMTGSSAGYDDSQDVNDSDSTSSGEDYQNIDISPQSGKESPLLAEMSLQTPLNHHSAQMTGSTDGYDHHEPRNLNEDVNDSDSTSSGEDYQNIDISPQSGKESPLLPEMSLQTPLNHHSAQRTGSSDGYDHHDPRNLNQESDNSSTTSEASYVNVPRLEERDQSSVTREDVSSDNDYDDAGDW